MAKADAPPDITGVVLPGAKKKKDAADDPYGWGAVGNMIIPGAAALFGPVVGGLLGKKGYTANEVMNQFAKTPMSGAQIQQLLYQAGGYYPANFVPLPGHLRTEDINAFKEAVTIVAHSKADIWTYLNEGAQAAVESGMGGGGSKRQGVAGGGNLAVTTTSDPAGLGAMADKIGQSILGRKLTDEQRAKAVASILADQRNHDQRLNAAREAESRANYDAQVGAADGGPDTYRAPRSIDIAEVDPQARLAAKIRADYGVEAGAHDIADQFGAFGQLLNQVGG